MHTRLATFRVRPDAVAAFRAATGAHVTSTQSEPGVLRFELLQAASDPTQFVIWMEFADDVARSRHMETPHYQQWRAEIAAWLAAPVESTRFV
ncbi:MAG: antibiotic biosynthesis monooxygenase, partial [Anaerolineales bacterium]|nr:antibiotic biosynthesis monooxygenase [Anaerolineales bacterium]